MNKTITAVSENIDKFRVNDALDAAYHFFWHDYCDWYLEMIKPRLYNAKDESEKKTALALASHVMKTSMELLHPFIPFITEEIWQHFRAADEESVVISAWPQPDESALDEEAEESVHILQEAIGSIRNIRAEMNVPPGKRVSLFVEADTAHKEFLKSQLVHFASLARVEGIRDVPPDFDKTDAAMAVVKNIELFIPMADLIDRDKERQRLEKELQRLQGLEKALQNKLNNPNFLQKAPAQVVETERKKLQNIQENLQKVRQNYEKFK